MKNHEFENEPELEPPFEVAEEFLDCGEDDEGRERTVVEVIGPALESAGVKFPQLTAPREGEQ